MQSEKLWGGRFQCETNSFLEKLNASINIDKRMYNEDVIGSQAYARALHSVALLTQNELDDICNGLELVKQEWDDGKFVIKGDEDIHSANERRLKELIGTSASKLHTGRSRNDQVITDMKLWLKKALHKLENKIKHFIKILIERANCEIDYLMPGYTHMQRAQPIRWSHWLLSHAWNMKADVDRLRQLYDNINVMPLGSGALAGHPFNIDRMKLARDLGFNGVTPNSMQAVSDRDFVVEFLFWASLLGVHLSRLSEDLINFSTREFNFVRISDAFSTGSSLMPQKRNPDSLELVRGIGAGLFGQCCSFMMILKGLPSTYNKDLQSDKEIMFSSYDKLNGLIDVISNTLQCLQVNEEECFKALSSDMLATDLAYYLVRKSVSFRDAHHIVGNVIAYAERKKVDVASLSLEEYQTFSKYFEGDVSKVWDVKNSVEQYQSIGGTSKSAVLKQIDELSLFSNFDS